jgi:dTDP-glucose 4,6-dehydratase
VHLAAETHVDRSIHAPTLFVETNVIGTCHLLESARLYWTELTPQARDAFRFHLVSTDEVYGDLGPEDPPFDERSRYAPSSPYAATKAAADHLVRAWHRTYALPTLITHSSNSYGPHQTRDKLIPLTICNALEGNPLPVYGGGTNIREWLYVDDHVRALRSVLVAGTPGRTYDIGGHSGCTNLEVVQTICTLLDRHVPRAAGPYADLIRFVADRPGHDRRYAVDDRRVREELAWREQVDFDEGLKRTVRWYLHRYGREWKP